MTDEELVVAALPLLRELIQRCLLAGSIQQAVEGVWVSVTIIEVFRSDVFLVVKLEDDAESIADATPI
jgi:hypothetical protein